MSRGSVRRWRVAGCLEALTPLHVGGMHADVGTDLTLAVNGRGQLYVPGTSLAGALREWFRTVFGVKAADALWGRTPKKGAEGRNSKDATSFILIEDATVQGGVVPELRDGVGIDRYSGAAARNVKYDREILPRGTTLCLEVSVEAKAAEVEEKRRRLIALLRALERGEVRLGAAKTRGLGRVRLSGIEIIEDDLASPEGVLALVKGAKNEASAQSLDEFARGVAGAEETRPFLEITVHWVPRGPVMVKADVEGLSIDMLPLLSQTQHEANRGKAPLAQVLTGAGIKGALRSHAERITATVLNVVLKEKPAKNATEFIRQVQRAPIVTALFGAPAVPARGEKDDKTPMAGLGALAVDDCYARKTITRDGWQNVLNAGSGSDDDSGLSETLKALREIGWAGAAGEAGYEPVMHNAIDRWTGGAADQFLYSVLEPPPGLAWEPIRMTLDPARLVAVGEEDDPNVKGAAMALLLLTLRDLASGRTPLGFGVTRGLGDIDVTEIRFKAHGALPPPFDALDGLVVSAMGFDGNIDAINSDWQCYHAPRKREQTA